MMPVCRAGLQALLQQQKKLRGLSACAQARRIPIVQVAAEEVHRVNYQPGYKPRLSCGDAFLPRPTVG